MRSPLFWILGLLHMCKGQLANAGNDRGLLNRRPLFQHSTPCSSGGNGGYFDAVEEDANGRTLLLTAGAAIGGAALGYHLGMKHKDKVVINNNIYNELPSPCVSVQSGGGGGIGGGGILSHHPILSNILNGGLWNNGGGAGNRLPVNRQPNTVNWNRAIRQFNRVVRPLTRGSIFR